MNTKINIGAVQMESKLGDKASNIEKALKYIGNYGDKLDIICFPEFFTTGYSLDLIGREYYDFAETIPGQTTDIFSKYASKYNTGIIGNIVEKDTKVEDILYDTTFVIDEKGCLLGKYRKVHVYPTEHIYFKRGTSFPIFIVKGIPIGLATCYDHGFGEMFRILARKGAKIVFIPSAIPEGYEYLLKLRTRARAQDNQIFTVAINSVGKVEDSIYCGNSMFVNPRGEIIDEAGEQEDILIGSVDLTMINNERKQEPLIKDSAFEIYMKEYKQFLDE